MKNKNGRPTKVKEMIVCSPDEIVLGNFVSEKEIEKYFCKHAKMIMKQIFNEEVTSVERQKRLSGSRFTVMFKKTDQLHAIRRMRAKIDVYIKCKSGNNYAIELKNPNKTKGTSSIYAVSQLLYYSTLLPEINKMVVLSTKYDKGFAEVIKKYNLPIDFILFAKNQMFLLV